MAARRLPAPIAEERAEALAPAEQVTGEVDKRCKVGCYRCEERLSFTEEPIDISLDKVN